MTTEDLILAIGHTLTQQEEEVTVEHVAELIATYRALPGNSSGGTLHIAIEDNNCDDRHLSWCAGLANGHGDTVGMMLAELLLAMPAYERVHAIDASWKTEVPE